MAREHVGGRQLQTDGSWLESPKPWEINQKCTWTRELPLGLGQLHSGSGGVLRLGILGLSCWAKLIRLATRFRMRRMSDFRGNRLLFGSQAASSMSE